MYHQGEEQTYHFKLVYIQRHKQMKHPSLISAETHRMTHKVNTTKRKVPDKSCFSVSVHFSLRSLAFEVHDVAKRASVAVMFGKIYNYKISLLNEPQTWKVGSVLKLYKKYINIKT